MMERGQQRTRSVPRGAALRPEVPLPKTPRQMAAITDTIERDIRKADVTLLSLCKAVNEGHTDSKYSFELNTIGSMGTRRSPRRTKTNDIRPNDAVIESYAATSRPAPPPPPPPTTKSNTPSTKQEPAKGKFVFVETQQAFDRSLSLLGEVWSQLEGMLLGGLGDDGETAMLASLCIHDEEPKAQIESDSLEGKRAPEYTIHTILHLLESSCERHGSITEVFGVDAELSNSAPDSRMRYFRFEGTKTRASLIFAKGKVVGALEAAFREREIMYN